MKTSGIFCAVIPALSFVVFGAAVQTQTTNAAAVFDVILRNGSILDGTGARSYRADLGISSGTIAKIGDLRAERAAVDLDVAGLFVAPGFINIHSHATANALPLAENMLTQGVTTEILNPDGGGPVDIAEQMALLAAPGLAVNIGAYVGFNSVWRTVVGSEDHRPTAEDLNRMRGMVVAGLEQGAWGVSAGLDYTPAIYAKTAEVIKVVEAALKWRTNFPNHERLTPESNFSSQVGITETIAIAEAAGLVPVITHMKAQGLEHGTAPALVAKMASATRSGHYTTADVYPYLAGQTGLGALLIPSWAQDGGREEMLKRFTDPSLRARIIAETEQAMKARLGGPDSVYLPATRQQLVDFMRAQSVSAGEAVVRILEEGNVPAILRFGVESDLVTLLQNPTTSIACDCGATTSTLTHPRSYGTFPRVLGRYVREQKVLSWEDAIRKMTALPANTIGMVDRGYLVPGMAADVTVFDPRTVIDHATYENPTAPSEGVRYVFVNGRLALRDGRVTGAQGGRGLTRTPHMPSRPMRVNVGRRVVGKGTVTTDAGSAPSPVIEIAFDVKQKAGARQATGFFRLTDPGSGTMIDMKTVSLLQTADKWASFTGRSQLRRGDVFRSITVTIEQSDPFADGRATVTVDVEATYRLTGSLASANVEFGRER